ncbi:hypothetical protein ENBRE01_2090 [Enteropsectra breve]|nr:hypothetical protein ENBRE01_2090 [Enteropsectra breve]
MDETPVYIDMIGSRTIAFKGEKNIEVITTGHTKTRLTVVLCISKSGQMLKSLVILKGLKNVPKCSVPNNLFVTTASKGSMNSTIMKTWINTYFDNVGPFRQCSDSLLIMDEFSSHKNEEILNILQARNVQTVFIPPKSTHYLQPLDVSINSIFKASLRKEWNEWMINGQKEFTAKGYRKKPNWGIILGFISRSINSISSDSIKTSFTLSGVSEKN